MAINDFSALIQLAATLCIAFVAVEYVKSFISILCERFFQFQNFITESFQECRSLLTDKDTLDHIDPIIIEGKSTNPEIEEAKRQNEALNKEIEEEEANKKEEVKVSCQVRSMSSLCFFLFLVSTSLLLFGGLERQFPDFSHIFITLLNLLSISYLFYGWLIGECEKPKKFRDFSSLRHASFGFITIFILSFVLTGVILIWEQCSISVFNIFWWYSLLAVILFTYLNFIVFTVKIRSKAKAFRAEVDKSKQGLIEKCIEVEKKVEDLKGSSRLNARLQAD